MSVMEKYEKSGKSTEEILYLTNLVIGDDTSRDERNETYTRWAKTYDEDFQVTYDYRGPALMADEVSKLFGDKHEISICDFGCGTGHGGVEMNQRGFKNIDALDVSRAMLEVAKEKGVYKKLILGELGEDKIESIPDNTYDVLTGVGCVFQNHINEDAFEELIRITKPGGHVLFIIPTRTRPKMFEVRYKQLVGSGAWKLVEKGDRPDFATNEFAELYTFEVLLKK